MSRWQSVWEAQDDDSDAEGEDEELEGEEDEDLEGEWELDPNDPTHPDFDLSEAAGYDGWEPTVKPVLLRRGMVFLLTILVLIGLMIPVLARITS